MTMDPADLQRPWLRAVQRFEPDVIGYMDEGEAKSGVSFRVAMGKIKRQAMTEIFTHDPAALGGMHSDLVKRWISNPQTSLCNTSIDLKGPRPTPQGHWLSIHSRVAETPSRPRDFSLIFATILLDCICAKTS